MNPKMTKGMIKINHLWFKITKIEHKWKCIMSRRTPKKMPVCQKWCRTTQTKCQIPKTAVKMRHKRINIVQHKLTLRRHNEIKCNPKWLKWNLWKMTTSSRRFKKKKKKKAKLSKLHKNIWLKQNWNAKRLKRPKISKIRCQITTKTPKIAKNYQI